MDLTLYLADRRGEPISNGFGVTLPERPMLGEEVRVSGGGIIKKGVYTVKRIIHDSGCPLEVYITEKNDSPMIEC